MSPAPRFPALSLKSGISPALVVALVAILGTAPVAAQDAALLPSTSVYVQAADAQNGSHALALGATLPWRDWRGSFWGSEVRGYWDISLSRWTANGVNRPPTTTVLEFTPSFRFTPDAGRSPFFLDAGIGATVSDRLYTTTTKAFSTRLNFATHLGVGVLMGEQRKHELQLRLQHVSNGGFKKPNPGENFVQLRYALHF